MIFVPDLARIQAAVCFEDWFGEMKIGGEKAALESSFPITPGDNSLVWARFWLEISRSLVALAIPVVGLLASARDKLLNMDTTTALIAVFILGFSADSVKSALLRGTAAAPAAPPTQQAQAAQRVPSEPSTSPTPSPALQPKAAAAGVGKGS